MIKFELLKDIGVLVLEPKNALSTDDFREISSVIDPYIREKGKLTGFLIEAASFPGWDSFGTFIERVRSPAQHYRVAIVTDAASLKIAPTIAQHFAHPEIRAFASWGRDKALEWLQS